jgi:hypothetical protein
VFASVFDEREAPEQNGLRARRSPVWIFVSMFGEHTPSRRNTCCGMECRIACFAFMFAEHFSGGTKRARRFRFDVRRTTFLRSPQDRAVSLPVNEPARWREARMFNHLDA